MWELHNDTNAAWIDIALANFDVVLLDHCHCEKKAAASAMALVNQYPECGLLVRRCVKLAQEELRHFQQVHEIVVQRGLCLRRDQGDPYAQHLVAQVRSGSSEQRMMDRLLVAALIEARSCERLGLLSRGLHDAHLAKFYAALATAEAGHHRLFVDLALHYLSPQAVATRWAELAQFEARLIETLPIEPRVH